MKKWKSVMAFILLFVLAYSIPIPVFAGSILDNLVKNPGFESGLDHWNTATYSTNYSVDTVLCFPNNINTLGLKSLKARATGYAIVSLSQEVLLPVSGTYQLSLLGQYENGLKPPNYGDISLELESKGESFKYTHPGAKEPDFDFSLTFSVAKSTTIKIILNIYNTTGIFDNVSLNRIGASPDALNGPNLLQNGSFEDKLDCWTQVGKENAFTTEAVAFSGKNSLYMGYFSNKPFEHEMQQSVTVSGIKEELYNLTSYVKINHWEGSPIIIMLIAKDENNTVVSSNLSRLIPGSATGWEKIQLSLEAPEHTTSVTIRLLAVAGKGSFYVDDIYLSKVV